MPFNIAALAKQLGPEVTGFIQDAVQGKGVSKLDKASAVHTAISNLLAPLDEDSGQPQGKSGIDKLQTVLDVAGVVDPTPTIDAINAGISLVRASKADTPEERSHHLKNAVISGISMIPLVGDIAKIGKLTGKTGSKLAAKETAVAAESVADTVVGAPPVVVPPTVTPPMPAGAVSAATESGPARGGFFRRNQTSQAASAAPPGASAPPVVTSPSSVPPVPGPSATPPPATSSAGGGSRNPPPPPPGTRVPPPGTGSPPLPPPPPTVTPPTTPTTSPFVPLIAGAAAGAAFGMMGGGTSYSRPQSYSLFGDTVGQEKMQAGKEAMQVIKNRGAEIFNPILDPVNALLHPLSAAATSIKGMVKAVDEVPSALLHWGESLKESQRHLMQWSGTLANAFLESEVRQHMREFGSAGRTAGTTADLTKALDDFKDDLQPFKDSITNISNKLSEISLKITNLGFKAATNWNFSIGGIRVSLGTIADLVNRYFSETDPSDTAAIDLMKNIRNLPDRLTKPPRR